MMEWIDVNDRMPDKGVSVLVSFGAYLLSDERDARTSEINKREVTHADLENWKTIVLG